MIIVLVCLFTCFMLLGFVWSRLCGVVFGFVVLFFSMRAAFMLVALCCVCVWFALFHLDFLCLICGRTGREGGRSGGDFCFCFLRKLHVCHCLPSRSKPAYVEMAIVITEVMFTPVQLTTPINNKGGYISQGSARRPVCPFQTSFSITF